MVHLSNLAGMKADNKGSQVFGSGVYFTPSIIYASHSRYANPIKMSTNAEYFPGKWVQVVLNLRLKPNSFKKHRQTLGCENVKIDLNYNNNELEWLVSLNSGEAILCGYMFRISDTDPLNLQSSHWWTNCAPPNEIRDKWYEYSEYEKKPTIFLKNQDGEVEVISRQHEIFQN